MGMMMKRLCAALLAGAVLSTMASAQPAAPATSAPANPDAIVPITAFAKRPFMQQPRISPDGTKLVVQMSKNGNGFLGLIDLTKPGSAPDFFIATTEFRDVGDRTVVSWRWVGNDNVVVTMQSRENIFGQMADLTRLAAYNIKTKKLTPLAWDHATAFASDILWIYNDKGKILLQRQSDAYGTEQWQWNEVVLVDVNTGQ